MKTVGNNVSWFPGANLNPGEPIFPEQLEPERLQQILMFQHWQAVYSAAVEVGPAAVLIEVLDADPQLKEKHIALYLRAKVTYGAYLERNAQAQQQRDWLQARREQRRQRMSNALRLMVAAVTGLLPRRQLPDLARQQLDHIAKHAPHLMAQDYSKPRKRKMKPQATPATVPQPGQEALQQSDESGQAAA